MDDTDEHDMRKDRILFPRGEASVVAGVICDCGTPMVLRSWQWVCENPKCVEKERVKRKGL